MRDARRANALRIYSMDYESFARRTFHVGRERPNAPAVRAFDLRRQPDGAHVYLNVEPGMFPTDDERAAL